MAAGRVWGRASDACHALTGPGVRDMGVQMWGHLMNWWWDEKPQSFLESDVNGNVVDSGGRCRHLV